MTSFFYRALDKRACPDHFRIGHICTAQRSVLFCLGEYLAAPGALQRELHRVNEQLRALADRDAALLQQASDELRRRMDGDATIQLITNYLAMDDGLAIYSNLDALVLADDPDSSFTDHGSWDEYSVVNPDTQSPQPASG